MAVAHNDPEHDRDDLKIPTHVAVIMDGNGRWARARHLPRTAGHRKGADAVRRTIEAAGQLGISYLTLFGFSSENWKRPVPEVADLMALLRRFIRSEADELHAKNVRVRVIGDRSALSPIYSLTKNLLPYAVSKTSTFGSG